MTFKEKFCIRILLVVAKFCAGHSFGNGIGKDIEALIEELGKSVTEAK